MIHYYIHYGSPNGGHLYHMKRYHYQHHFVYHELGKLLEIFQLKQKKDKENRGFIQKLLIQI